MTIYGYARVSTYGQMKDGNSIEDQTRQLKEYNCDVIIEEAYSGKTTDRPEFSKLINQLKESDTLIVTKLDRFARTLIEGEKIVSELIERGVKIIIVAMSMILDNTPNSKLMRQIFFSFAEYERNMIVERTQSGKAIAKQKDDFTEGRPKVHKKKAVEHALSLLETHTAKEVVEMTGISKATLYRERAKREAKAIEEKEGN